MITTAAIEKDGKLSAKLRKKGDDFDFGIVNFLFLSSNIPFCPFYGLHLAAHFTKMLLILR